MPAQLNLAPQEAEQHKIVTQAVHEAGGKICLQILHAGRYAYSPNLVAPVQFKRRLIHLNLKVG